MRTVRLTIPQLTNFRSFFRLCLKPVADDFQYIIRDLKVSSRVMNTFEKRNYSDDYEVDGLGSVIFVSFFFKTYKWQITVCADSQLQSRASYEHKSVQLPRISCSIRRFNETG